MDQVALADAKRIMVAGMAAILLETEDESYLRKCFEECIPKATDGWANELNAIIRRRNEGLPPLTGTAVTRQHWIGMIAKIYEVFGEVGARDMFEAMLGRVKAETLTREQRREASKS